MSVSFLQLRVTDKRLLVFLRRRVFFLQEIFPLNLSAARSNYGVQPLWFFFLLYLKGFVYVWAL